MTWLDYDDSLVDDIAATMDLRAPNAHALRELARQVSAGDGREVIADLATGVGKTYLAAGLVDYLARGGVRNILIVTPGATVLAKTLRNFTPGDPKFVPGAAVRPLLVTSENFARGEVGDALHDPARLKLFVFTVQTLISPSAKANRKAYEENEVIGDALYAYLQKADDLVVIVDEHHVIREKAKRFNAAVHDLGARAVVGLTATPDRADVEAGKVVYRYTLAEAIADRLVKVPVIVYRQDGRKDLGTQLADACSLRAKKEAVWVAYGEAAGVPPQRPVLFVVCQSIKDAEEVASELRRDDLLPDEGQVLLITSESSDAALAALAKVEEHDSSVRAIVSVDKLKEGWDVRNIGVIVARRALASQTLTEQILGRGLRLPYGRRTDLDAIDQVDIVAHESYAELLRDKNALLERLVTGASKPDATETATATLDFAGLNGPDPEDPGTGFAVVSSGDPIGDESIPGLGAAELLLAQEMGKQQAQIGASMASLATAMPRNAFAPITFPRQDPVLEPVRFTLNDVSLLTAEQQGSAFRHDPHVRLVRQAIDAQRDLHGELHVITRMVDGADATRVTVSAEAIKQSLLHRILASGMIEPELTEQLRAIDIVDAFLRGAGVDQDSAWEWSADHAERAEAALLRIIEAAHKGKQTVSTYRWVEVAIPLPQQMPAHTRGVFDDFVQRAWVGPWQKSIDRYAAFDSASAELLLAKKLETWDEVEKWTRVYNPGPAWIPWSGGKYYPDFVVTDLEGVNWVLEAKGDTAKEDSRSVQAKAEAAESWVERANGAVAFGRWRYKLVTETDIGLAVDWRQLIKS